MFSSTTQTTGRFRGLALGVVVFALCAVAGLVGSASVASASSCGAAPATWPSLPKVLLHLNELEGPGNPATTSSDPAKTFGYELGLLAQAQDAVNQFNAIGATSARVSSVETTFDPFTYAGSYNDSVPTIHVGFRPGNLVVDSKGNRAGGKTTGNIYLSNNCSPTVTIEFPDQPSANWSFSSPFALENHGAHYYDAGPTAPTVDGSGQWFRTSFLHELEHAFGLNHTATEYATMNHRGAGDPNGGFPWANRADKDSVMPLPWDVGQIRNLYPASGTRWDIAALNTWFHVTTSSTGSAADQVKLCTPSLGFQFTKSQTTSGPCGTDGSIGGSTRVSEGDTLRTRFAIANYSTGSMHVTSKLWLSTDDELSEDDIPANSWDIRDIPAESSSLAEVGFRLSAMPEGTFHPIVMLSAWHVNSDGTVDDSSKKNDWIPLRGTVFHCDGVCSLSGTPTSGPLNTPTA
jgi:hypothetical protein